MNLQELKSLKSKLINDGYNAYPSIAKIVDTLGFPKRINSRDYRVLEYDGITLLHLRNISGAKIGKNQTFEGWIYNDSLFVTVGEQVPFCPFRSDRVMYIGVEGNSVDKVNEIFVPHHMNWYNRIMELLPKAEGILGEASHNEIQAELIKLSKELFLEEME